MVSLTSWVTSNLSLTICRIKYSIWLFRSRWTETLDYSYFRGNFVLTEDEFMMGCAIYVVLFELVVMVELGLILCVSVTY